MLFNWREWFMYRASGLWSLKFYKKFSKIFFQNFFLYFNFFNVNFFLVFTFVFFEFVRTWMIFIKIKFRWSCFGWSCWACILPRSAWIIHLWSSWCRWCQIIWCKQFEFLWWRFQWWRWQITAFVNNLVGFEKWTSGMFHSTSGVSKLLF